MLNINKSVVETMQKNLSDVSVSKNSIVGTIPIPHMQDYVFSVAIESANLWELNPQFPYDVILSFMQIEDCNSRLVSVPSNVKWGNKFTSYIRKVNTPESDIEKHLHALSEELIQTVQTI